MGLWKQNYENLKSALKPQIRKAGHEMEKKEKEPRGFYVEKGSFFAHAAVTILVLSMAARLLGTMNLWNGGMNQLLIQILLPVGSMLLFILFILLLGRIALWSTILPVLGGAAFFILSVFEQGPGWTMFICIALAFLAAFLYTATLSGMIRSKWLLVLAFALIFAYQIVFRAIPVFGSAVETVSFIGGMTLLSSLGMVFAMLCASLALRRKKRPEPELPKIKDPVVVKPEEPSGAENAESVIETASAEAPAETAQLEAEQIPDAPAAEAASEETEAGIPEEDSRE